MKEFLSQKNPNISGFLELGEDDKDDDDNVDGVDDGCYNLGP